MKVVVLVALMAVAGTTSTAGCQTGAAGTEPKGRDNQHTTMTDQVRWSCPAPSACANAAEAERVIQDLISRPSEDLADRGKQILEVKLKDWAAVPNRRAAEILDALSELHFADTAHLASEIVAKSIQEEIYSEVTYSGIRALVGFEDYDKLETLGLEGSAAVRRAVAMALGDSPDSSAVALLGRMTTDNNEEVRIASFRSLSRYCDSSSLALIEDCLRVAKGRERVECAWWLASCGGPGTGGRLCELAVNSGTEVRRAVMQGVLERETDILCDCPLAEVDTQDRTVRELEDEYFRRFCQVN